MYKKTFLTDEIGGILIHNMNTTSKLYSRLKPQAIQLRKKGKTFSEIQNIIGPIPKSTLSNWLKDVSLTDNQHKRIHNLMKENGTLGRYIGAQRNHELRVNRLANIANIAKDEYRIFINEPMFLAGLILYLAEGSKKSEQFQFMNSDPKLMKYMILWVTKYGDKNFKTLRFRLYIHKLYKNENCENFWIRDLKADSKQFLKTIYKTTNRAYKKNPQYKGCLRLEVSGSELYWKTMTWRDCFYSELK
jgi:hypothetical protein